MPELINIWKECADIQTADMLNLKVPTAEHITVVTKPSDFQVDMVKDLADRAKLVRNRLVEPTVDNMLRITSDGRKLALDQRLGNDMLPDNPDSKLNKCVENVMQNLGRNSRYKRYTAYILRPFHPSLRWQFQRV